MNWLRRNVRVNKNQDPFQFLNVASPQTLLANSTQNELSRSKKQLVTVGILIAIVLVAITVVVSIKIDLNFGKTPTSYAYFEIKAIDRDGRPVAGAHVNRDGEAIGVTDSFGEWRRYIQVELGQELKINFTKNRSGQLSQATKTLPIPDSKPTKGDIEIYSTVQLHNKGKKAIPTEIEEPIVRKVATDLPPTMPLPKEKVIVTVNQNMLGQNSSIYISVKNQILSYVNKFILQDTNQFKHDCTSLSMSYIPYQSTRGFIEIECQGGKNWSLIRNIESSRKVTASKVFSALVQTARMHRTGSSPVAGWQKLNLVFTGNMPKDSRIYVSGYPVMKGEDGYWHYYGQRNGQSNLTIIAKSRVEYRQRISNNPYGARYINLPHKTFARRP